MTASPATTTAAAASTAAAALPIFQYVKAAIPSSTTKRTTWPTAGPSSRSQLKPENAIRAPVARHAPRSTPGDHWVFLRSTMRRMTKTIQTRIPATMVTSGTMNLSPMSPSSTCGAPPLDGAPLQPPQPVLRRRHLREAPEDPAEVGRVLVAAIGGDFLQRARVLLQHELGPVDAHARQVVAEAHGALASEQARDVARGQAERAGDRGPRDGLLVVLLRVQAQGLVGARGLARVVRPGFAQLTQAGVQQGLGQQPVERPGARRAAVGAGRGQRPQHALRQAVARAERGL